MTDEYMLDLEDFSDRELVVLLKKGDHQAYAVIYNRYKGPLFLHAFKMVKDVDDAQDLLHELFSMLWRKCAEYNPEIPLAPFLYRSLKNLVLNLISYKKVRLHYAESLETFVDRGEYITDEKIRENELIALIEREVALLPTKMREIFELSRKVHLSHNEIAQKLGISDKTVKKHVNNALKILRTKLDIYFLILL